MQQTGNCGKISIFLCKRRVPSQTLSLLTTHTSLMQAGHLSPLARNRKYKTGRDLSSNQAQFLAARANPVLPSLL